MKNLVKKIFRFFGQNLDFRPELWNFWPKVLIKIFGFHRFFFVKRVFFKIG